MKATKKLALVCAALAAATFGFVSCSSDDDSDYDDNATAVALIRQATSWKATGRVSTTKTEDAVAGTTSTVVVEIDYSTGNKTTTYTDVDKNGKTTTTVVSIDRSTGKTTIKSGSDSLTDDGDNSEKYTSYDNSDVLAFAFNGTYTETTTVKYVDANKLSSTSTTTEKGSFSGYPTLANQTITLLPTSSESSSSSATSSTSSSNSTDVDYVSTKTGKVSSDKNTLTVTTTETKTNKSTTGTTTDTNKTTTTTTVVTYAKQ